jgi:fucose 4-O-acetylase-like acetyltransferase
MTAFDNLFSSGPGRNTDVKDDTAGRLFIWDNAKGVLIFLVVFGHFLLPYRSVSLVGKVFNLIYLFHMPAFVFVSGYLSRIVSDNRKSVIKLCFAYLIFNSLMMVYSAIYEGITPSLLKPYYSYWYLLALIAYAQGDSSLCSGFFNFDRILG